MSLLKSLRAAPKDAGTVAAVDLGSNSFHMIVARHQHGSLQVVDRLKEMVRLAAGLDEAGGLAPEARERALACLQRFGQRIRDLPRGSVRAVGTNTLRQAGNEQRFLADAEDALGHPIEVVSGVEEARLVYLGVAHSIPEDGQRRLVVDIGGGSTELIVGERTEARLMESLHMGCVNMTDRFFPDGDIDKVALKRLEQAVLMELEPIQGRYRGAGWQHAVGASGTIKAVEAVVRETGWVEQGVSRDALEKLRQAILKAGHVKRLRFDALSAERRPVFAAGALVLHGVFQALGIERMQVSDGALREGLLYDLLGRMRDEDARDRTVRALQSRYHVDQAQAARVGETAQRLLLQVADDWHLTADDERLLQWAALLHEIGLDISHSQYQKHGEYVVRNADMGGFSRQDQAELACLIRAHRRKLADAVFDGFPAARQESLKRLAVLLRLAVVLHRGRHAEPIDAVELIPQGRELQLSLSAQWIEQHPLTRAELDEEDSYLKALDFRLLLAGGDGHG